MLNSGRKENNMFKFGIMGAGSIAEKFCQAVQLVDGAEVAAVSSKSMQRAEEFAKKNEVPAFYGNYKDMLEKAGVDAVYIATTNNFHYDNCMLCLDYGKAVLCEKTMVMSKKEALAVFKKAKEKKVFVMEAMWSRFIPAIAKAKEWIDKDRIGTIHIATYTGGINVPDSHRIFSPELGGGALYDLLVYPIEIVTYLLNQPLRGVKADLKFSSTGVDSVNNVLLQFEQCQAGLQCTTHARIPSPSGFYGSKGYIRIEQTHRASVCEMYDSEFCLVERFEAPIQNGFEFEIAEVKKCVEQGKLESDIMPHSATLQCLEIMEECFKQNRK